jgi:hypothetical protein
MPNPTTPPEQPAPSGLFCAPNKDQTLNTKLKELQSQHVSTTEAAQALHIKAQTLRLWACRQRGPIAPVRIGGRLRWRVSDIEALINGGAA